MRIIVNKFIPIHGYVAMMFYNVIFWHKCYEKKLQKETYKALIVNHESIHLAQEKDFALSLKKFPKLQIIVGGTLFYIKYLSFWIINLFKDPSTAYKNIPFEKEAYANQANLKYLDSRENNSWKNYKV